MRNKIATIEIDGVEYFVKRKVKHAELFMSQKKDDDSSKAEAYSRAFVEMLREGYEHQGVKDIEQEDLEAFVAANYGALMMAVAPLFNFAKKEEIARLKKNLMSGKSGDE